MVINDRETFITENLGLVHSIAKRYRGRGIDYDDLYQSGCIGLIKAADNFDSSKGFAFSTYAVPVIMGEIKRLFRDGGPVKVSRCVKEKSLKVQTLREKFEASNQREPTVSELSEISGISQEELIEVLEVLKPVKSLSVIYDDESETLDIPFDNSESVFDKLVICEASKKLTELEKNIVNLRYFYDKTQSETAVLTGLSQVQVSRKEKAILQKLREYIK